jgi:hypothetical protein
VSGYFSCALKHVGRTLTNAAKVTVEKCPRIACCWFYKNASVAKFDSDLGFLEQWDKSSNPDVSRFLYCLALFCVGGDVVIVGFQFQMSETSA